MLSFFVRILGLNLLLLLCWPLLIGTWQRRRHVLLKALGLLNWAGGMDLQCPSRLLIVDRTSQPKGSLSLPTQAHCLVRNF